jgi:hypothetical protein
MIFPEESAPTRNPRFGNMTSDSGRVKGNRLDAMSKKKQKRNAPAKRIYVLYDERGWYDVDEAAILLATDNLQEAKNKRNLYPNSVIYSYRQIYSKKDKQTLLVDEQLEE